jgi:hypothetical protein
MQIRCTAFVLTQLLALRWWGAFPLMDIVPWHKGVMITAGLFGQWLRIQFIGFRVHEVFDPNSGQFVMPLRRNPVLCCNGQLCGNFPHCYSFLSQGIAHRRWDFGRRESITRRTVRCDRRPSRARCSACPVPQARAPSVARRAAA